MVQERDANLERMTHVHGIRIPKKHVDKIRANFQPGDSSERVKLRGLGGRCGHPDGPHGAFPAGAIGANELGHSSWREERSREEIWVREIGRTRKRTGEFEHGIRM